MLTAISLILASQAVVIYVDNRQVCGMGGRVSTYYQDAAEAKARRLARDLRRDGKKVRIVRLHPGQRINSRKYEVPVMVPLC